MTLAADRFRRRWLREGVAAGPALLETWIDGRLGRSAVRELVLEVWAEVDEPRNELEVGTWIRLFRRASFPRPATSLDLFRPAFGMKSSTGERVYPEDRGLAMGWGTNLLMARWAAGVDVVGREHEFVPPDGAKLLPPAVWTVTAPPEAVLADFDEIDHLDIRLEGGVIVDPRRLPRARLTPAAALTAEERVTLRADRLRRLRARPLDVDARATLEAQAAANRRRSAGKPVGDAWGTAKDFLRLAGAGPCPERGADCSWPTHTDLCWKRRSRAAASP